MENSRNLRKVDVRDVYRLMNFAAEWSLLALMCLWPGPLWIRVLFVIVITLFLCSLVMTFYSSGWSFMSLLDVNRGWFASIAGLLWLILMVVALVVGGEARIVIGEFSPVVLVVGLLYFGVFNRPSVCEQ